MFAVLRSARRPIGRTLLALSLLHAAACGSGWKPVTTPPPEVGSAEPGTVYRFRVPSGDVVALRNPAVRADSIVGVRWAPGAHIMGDSTQAIARSGAEVIGWRTVAGGGGGGAGAGLALLGLALVVGLAAAASGSSLGPSL